MNTFPIDLREWRAQAVSMGKDDFTVELTDGRAVTVPLAWFPRLFHALSSAPTPAGRANWRWIGGGIGIHWPDLDSDGFVADIAVEIAIIEGRSQKPGFPERSPLRQNPVSTTCHYFPHHPNLRYNHHMILPADAQIAAEKLTQYLLVPKARNDKSKWLRRAGYTLDNWSQLEVDLRHQILSQDAVRDETNPYGEIYRIEGDLRGPNGRTLRATTIWMREHETGQTKFITMYPA